MLLQVLSKDTSAFVAVHCAVEWFRRAEARLFTVPSLLPYPPWGPPSSRQGP